MSDILKSVPPGWTLRPLQEQVLTEVAAAFDSGQRFVIVEAPPGCGKSLVAATLSAHYGRSYVCTLTKQLQDQYLELFEVNGAKVFKGKANFQCERAQTSPKLEDRDITCEVGALRYKGKNACQPCCYQVAKAEALRAPMTLCNYSSYLYGVNWTPKFDPRRPLLILDEGHSVEEVMMDFVSVSIDASRLPIKMKSWVPMGADLTVDNCFAWLAEFLETAFGLDEVAVSKMSEKVQLELERMVSKVQYALNHYESETWIVEPLEKKSGFVLKPLTVKSFGNRIFQHGARVLLMSATVLDPESMASSLGIEDYEFVQVGCPFPKENRPVIAGGLNMTKAYREESWPLMVQQVSDILDAHDAEKGLLLTPSNEMLHYIEKALRPDQRERLVIAYGSTRMEAYKLHVESPRPTVLAASGLWEGADLKDELSRFQIIPAVPRPYWGGQIAARAKMDDTWYRWRTYCQLVQGVGRSVRSDTDSATTYVLDVALRREADRPDTMLPPWFREAMELT